MKTVFISSTYIDLKPHREEIWRILDSYEVTIKGMESFGARSSEPLETCLEEIKSSDIFIGIIGMNYGSVDAKTGKSFTELEYEEAKKTNKEIYIYLIKEDEVSVPVKNIDFINHLSLQHFKNQLKQNHTVDWFISHDDLAHKIYIRLNGILQNRKSWVYREKVIKGRVFHFVDGTNRWCIVVGYQNNSPFEIYISESDVFFLPDWVTTGEIVKSDLDDTGQEIRYDFSYVNNYGGKVTMEGVSIAKWMYFYEFQMTINKILPYKNLPVETIIEIITESDFSNIKNQDEFKALLIKIVRNQD